VALNTIKQTKQTSLFPVTFFAKKNKDDIGIVTKRKTICELFYFG
jgi:hypothetical protein